MSQFGHSNFRTVHCLPSGMLRENEQTKNKTKILIGGFPEMVAFSAFISKLLSNYKTIWIDLHYSGICIKGDSCIPVNFGVDLTEW